MLYSTILILLGIGGIAWLIGEFFGYTGIGALGAVFILIAGGAIVLTGLEVQTGTVTTYDYTTVNNSTVASQESVTYQYESQNVLGLFGVPTIVSTLGIGGLLMILGTVLMSQSLSNRL